MAATSGTANYSPQSRALTGMLLGRGVRDVLQIHDTACVGDKKSAGAAHPPVESDALHELWQWTRDECPAFRRFLDTGEELEEEQNLDGFDAHLGDADEMAVAHSMCGRDHAEIMEVQANDSLPLAETVAHEDAHVEAMEAAVVDGSMHEVTAIAEAEAVEAGVDAPRGEPEPAAPTAEEAAAAAEEAARVAKVTAAEAARAKAAEVERARKIAQEAATKEEALRVEVGSVLSIALSPQKVEGAVVTSVDTSGVHWRIEPL